MRRVCTIEKAAVKRGLTADTAKWICALAGELNVKEGELLKALLKAAKHGVWLREEEWRILAAAAGGRRLAKVAEAIALRVRQGYTVEEALAEVLSKPVRMPLAPFLTSLQRLVHLIRRP
ncbi:hypothetical protein [Pyrobaculum aerophilum]|uniref:hypothetical protein n=1 Tax=Pyrobaculum aerophilum TaxID=13773 RepID=UPI0015F27D23|nr:hypothetical protein [Pyrobaculum aerophilum]